MSSGSYRLEVGTTLGWSLLTLVFALFLYGVGRFWTIGEPLERDWTNIGYTMELCGRACRWIGVRLALLATAVMVVSLIALAI